MWGLLSWEKRGKVAWLVDGGTMVPWFAGGFMKGKKVSSPKYNRPDMVIRFDAKKKQKKRWRGLRGTAAVTWEGRTVIHSLKR